MPEPGRLPFAGRAALFHRPDTHLGHAFQLPCETVDVGLFLDFAVVVGVEYRRPDRLDGLEAGQEALRRDVARIERKIDRQGNDIADTLYYITQSVDDELRKAR